jgi:hypothetical protein
MNAALKNQTVQQMMLGLLLLCFVGCKKEPDPEYRVPADVEPYIQAFIKEAKDRGLDMKIDNLIVEFDKPTGDYICGVCKGMKSRQKHIVLGIQPYCWKDANNFIREALVFHELGHCYLARFHKTDKFADGTYASLMNPEDTEVYSSCIYPIGGGNECNKTARRKYYIDELFNENTLKPAWAK